MEIETPSFSEHTKSYYFCVTLDPNDYSDEAFVREKVMFKTLLAKYGYVVDLDEEPDGSATDPNECCKIIKNQINVAEADFDLLLYCLYVSSSSEENVMAIYKLLRP